jgi:peptidoglycan/LPS O-acetylase OafA/YrhL
MAPVSFLVHGLAVVQAQPPATAQMPLLRVVARVLIGILIAVLLTYIVIEQIGSWRRRRSGRE